MRSILGFLRTAPLRLTVFSIFLSMAGQSVYAAESVLQPGPGEGKDIWTTSVFCYCPPGGGPGGGRDDHELVVGGFGDLYYSLLEFDLSGMPPNASFAKLELFAFPQRGVGTTGMYLDRITEFWDWKTMGTGSDFERLWWADRPAAVQWIPGALPAPIEGQWYSIDITDLYNAWQDGTHPNYGLQLRPVSNANRWNEFYSSDFIDDPSLRPKLVVEPLVGGPSAFEAIVSNSVTPFFGAEWDKFRDKIYNLLSLYPDGQCYTVKKAGDFDNFCKEPQGIPCQDLLTASLTQGAGASFVPHFGLTLGQAAAAGGYDHFNWVQFLDRTWDQNTATGADFECEKAKVVGGTEDCELDPPFGGSNVIACIYGRWDENFKPQPVRDRFPPYLDEQFTIDGLQIYDKKGNRVAAGETRLEAWTLTDKKTLLFSDAPGGNVRFKTCLVGVANSQNGVANATVEIIDLPETCFWWYVVTDDSLTRSILLGGFIDPDSFTDGEKKLFRRFCIGVRGLDLRKCVKAMPWLELLLLDD